MITRHGFIIWTTTADDSQNTKPLRAAADAVFLRLETAKPVICLKTNLKIAGIATVATGIAKSAIHQAIDYKG